ncbi:NHL repeat containing protein [Oopsacas minuta]|uniref:NHL repeat containing protein n=1 Tax=Oopsacas minuta TaxID=111878 RepID=A0AAV7K0N1_9METZ|nr:NHL repeat containing protein [Oopsacas minuta]
MATQFPETICMPLLDPIEVEINQSIDRLISILNQRRVHLLTTLRNRREEIRANQLARKQTDQQLLEARTLLEGQITHNLLQSMQGRIGAEMEAKKAEIHANIPPPQELKFVCDTHDIEEFIACLGEITQHEIQIPKYSAFQQPIFAVGERGSEPGEFDGPRGVSIETHSGHIYVADWRNSRIQIFSQTGDLVNIFGDQHLNKPWGVLIYQDNIYVTDTGHHTILQYKLSDLTMIKLVGSQGSGSEEFDSLKQLAISPNQHLYVPDHNNNRIQIMTTNLEFKDSLRHESMTQPVDVKFSNKEMFVMSYKDNPCIHVFTLSGEKSRSLVTRGKGMQVASASFFCLDAQSNILISDSGANKIKVFSPEGNLLHAIGKAGCERGMFDELTGIAIHKNRKLITLSRNKNFGLQIYTA